METNQRVMKELTEDEISDMAKIIKGKVVSANTKTNQTVGKISYFSEFKLITQTSKHMGLDEKDIYILELNHTGKKSSWKTYEIYKANRGEDGKVENIHIATVKKDANIAFQDMYLENLKQKLGPLYQKLGLEDKDRRQLYLNVVRDKDIEWFLTTSDLKLEDLPEEIQSKVIQEASGNKEKMIDIEKEEIAQSIAKKQNIDVATVSANMVEINLDQKITNYQTFRDIVPGAKSLKRVFAIPGKDFHSFSFQAIGSNGLETLDSLVETEGTNPTEEITHINQDGSKVQEKQVSKIFKIQGKQNEGFTITRGQYGEIQVDYFRRTPEDEYVTMPVVKKDGTNGEKIASKQVRDAMAPELRNTSSELEEITHNAEVAEETCLNEDGIQIEETEKEKIIHHFMEEGYSKDWAEKIYQYMLDYKMSEPEAKEIVDRQIAKQSKERTPGGDAFDRLYRTIP